MMEYISFVILGIVAGILSGFFGIGGGIVIIPALILFFGMDQHTAQGTSLGALLLPVGLLAFLEYYRNGHVHVKGAFLIAFGLFLGAFLGAYIANKLSSAVLSKLFAIFLMAVALRILMKGG